MSLIWKFQLPHTQSATLFDSFMKMLQQWTTLTKLLMMTNARNILCVGGDTDTKILI